MITINPKYSIGDKVYYKVPESNQGIIIDICYSVVNDKIEYLIGLGFELGSIWCTENEISFDKSII